MRGVLLVICVSCCAASGGCGIGNMRDGARVKPFEQAEFFPEGNATRLPVPQTVARGSLRDEALATGKKNGELVKEIPLELTMQTLTRGRERFGIHCAICHGQDGAGRGLIVERGFVPPPSFHESRLRDAPVGHFFDVMTRGYGAMYPYAARVKLEDRWAIAAYIRALQLSQNARIADVSDAERKKLEAP
jgi:mono/diheme cytochrome c family protein